MLQVTEEGRRLIREALGYWSDPHRAPRVPVTLARTKPPKKRKLGQTYRRKLIDQTAAILQKGEPSVFAFEGFMRHGLRAGLCLKGWSWKEADAIAADVLASAFNQIGAKRPTYQQGQPDWTHDGVLLIERERCVRCFARQPREGEASAHMCGVRRRLHGQPGQYTGCGLLLLPPHASRLELPAPLAALRGGLAMTIRGKVEPLAKLLGVIVQEELSPAAQGRAVAAFAKKTLQEAQEQNRRVLGRVPQHEQFVDERRGASLDSATGRSTIVFEFDVVEDITSFVIAELERVSPVDSGAYRKAHMIFADGRQVLRGEQARQAEQYIFLNPLPYSRKIEMGRMKMRVSGTDRVYQQAARAAQRRFSNLAQVRFTYQSPIGTAESGKVGRASRVPAISITLR